MNDRRLLAILAPARSGSLRRREAGASPEEAARALGRALAFLEKRQLPWGEVRADRYGTSDLRDGGRRDSGVFGTTVALQALAGGSTLCQSAFFQRGLSWLLAERDDAGLWRYWSSRSPERIVPDVDDTSCAAHLLERFRPESAGADARMAVLRNRDSRGRFLTWFRPPGEMNDVDAVVNANACLLLGDDPGTAAAVAWLIDIVRQRREASSYWYYLDDLALYYAVTRAWREAKVAALWACRSAIVSRTLLRRGPDGSFGDELATGLALCILQGWGGMDRQALSVSAGCLLRSQRSDGSWPARAYYAGPTAPSPRSVWWGSPEITTAICIEALAGLASGAVEEGGTPLP
ncbi:MAG: hypothetical protein FJX74_22350 [Armatimonadetes bacterium]|nr:hypothetical protein [Armatimonadota bacterium]